MRPIASREEYRDIMLPLTGDRADEIEKTSSELKTEGYWFRDMKAEAIYSAVSGVLKQEQKTCQKESSYGKALYCVQVLNDAAAVSIKDKTGNRTVINGNEPLLKSVAAEAEKLFSSEATPTFLDIIEKAKEESASHTTALKVLEHMTEVADALDNLPEVGRKRGRS